MKIVTSIIICLFYFYAGTATFAEDSPERLRVPGCDVVTQLRHIAAQLNLRLFMVMSDDLYKDALTGTNIDGSSEFWKEKFDVALSQSIDEMLGQYFQGSHFSYHLDKKNGLLYVELCKLSEQTTQFLRLPLNIKVDGTFNELTCRIEENLKKIHSRRVLIDDLCYEDGYFNISVIFKNVPVKLAIQRLLRIQNKIRTVILKIPSNSGSGLKRNYGIYFSHPTEFCGNRTHC